LVDKSKHEVELIETRVKLIEIENTPSPLPPKKINNNNNNNSNMKETALKK